MRLSRLLVALLGLWAPVVMTGCAGCGDTCAVDGDAALGCACATDQDCGALPGGVLVCVDGACVEGDPQDVPSPLGSCDDDGGCPDGSACGLSGACHPAPRCQRVALARLESVDATTGNPGEVQATLEECRHTWIFDDARLSTPASFSIGLDGALSFDAADPPCARGVWRAAHRAGVLFCGDGAFVVVPPGDASRVCLGTACGEGCAVLETTADGGALGVCP